MPDGSYVRWNGTSGATPIVAGVVALVMAAHPELGAADGSVEGDATLDRETLGVRGAAAEADAFGSVMVLKGNEIAHDER